MEERQIAHTRRVSRRFTSLIQIKFSELVVIIWTGFTQFLRNVLKVADAGCWANFLKMGEDTVSRQCLYLRFVCGENLFGRTNFSMPGNHGWCDDESHTKSESWIFPENPFGFVQYQIQIIGTQLLQVTDCRV
jgi:hypothetical protein